MEVMEEEELAAMRAHQEHFEQLRNAELVATQRMEAAEKRRMEEKERRLAQEQDRVQRERVVREKVAASTFARGYLNGLMGQVFDRLYQSGFFYDPVQREVEEHFMPWLMDQTLAHLKKYEIACQVAKKLVQNAVTSFAETRAAVTESVSQQYASQEKYSKEELAAAMAEAQERLAEASQRAHFVLHELHPAILSPEQVEQVRTELVAQAEEEVKTSWELAKAAVRKNVQADAKAKLEAQRAAVAAQVHVTSPQLVHPKQMVASKSGCVAAARGYMALTGGFRGASAASSSTMPQLHTQRCLHARVVPVSRPSLVHNARPLRHAPTVHKHLLTPASAWLTATVGAVASRSDFGPKQLSEVEQGASLPLEDDYPTLPRHLQEVLLDPTAQAEDHLIFSDEQRSSSSEASGPKASAAGTADDDFFAGGQDDFDDEFEVSAASSLGAIEDDFFSAASARSGSQGAEAPMAELGPSGQAMSRSAADAAAWCEFSQQDQNWADFDDTSYQAPAARGSDASTGFRDSWGAAETGFSRRGQNHNREWQSSPKDSSGQYGSMPPREAVGRRSTYGGELDQWAGWQEAGKPTALRQRGHIEEFSFPTANVVMDPFDESSTAPTFASSCHTLAELLQLVEQSQRSMTAQHVVDVLLHSIVIETRGTNARMRKQLQMEAQQFAADITPLVAANVSQFNGEQLLRVMQSLTYLELPDTLLLHALLDKAGQEAIAFQPAQLHDLMWIVASNPTLQPSAEWLSHVAQLCQPVLDQFEHDKAASLLRFFVCCGVAPSGEWLEEYLVVVQPQLRAMHPMQALHMLSALACTGHQPSASFLSALDVALVSWDIGALGTEGHKRLLLTLMQWRHKPSGIAMSSIVNGAMAGPIPPRGVEAMELTTLQLQLGAEPSVRHMSDVAMLLVAEIQSGVPAGQVVQMVLALAQWTQLLPACGQSLRRCCRLLLPVLTASSPSVLAEHTAALQPKGVTTPAKQLAMLLGAVSVLAVELPQAFVEDAANALAVWGFQGLTGCELASTLPVLESIGSFQPASTWLATFLSALTPLLPQTPPEQLLATLQALATLNPPIPTEWWPQLAHALQHSNLDACPPDALSKIVLALGVLWFQSQESQIRSGLPLVQSSSKQPGPGELLAGVLLPAAVKQAGALGKQDMSRLSLGLQMLSTECGQSWLQRFDVFVQGKGEVVVSLVG